MIHISVQGTLHATTSNPMGCLCCSCHIFHMQINQVTRQTCRRTNCYVMQLIISVCIFTSWDKIIKYLASPFLPRGKYSQSSLQSLGYSHALSSQHKLSTKTWSYNLICLGTLCIHSFHPLVILDLRDAVSACRVIIYRQKLNFWHDFSTYLPHAHLTNQDAMQRYVLKI